MGECEGAAAPSQNPRAVGAGATWDYPRSAGVFRLVFVR